MDPLSDVLGAVRLTGGLFLDACFTAPWSVTARLTADDCRPFLSAAAPQLICYHVVIDGRLLVIVDGAAPVEVCAGEIVLLPRNDTHTLASAAGLASVSAGGLIQPSPNGGLARISHGGGGAATHIVCGFLGTEDGFNPLIATLPQVLKLDIREGTSRDWIEASVRFAAGELAIGRIASSSILARLSESLLVEAVRQYASAAGEAAPGWLKGSQDPYVGRALALIHRQISAPWSADSLARSVALSRSAFMERFRLTVGVPPIRYLTTWRLQMARRQLRDTGKTIGQLARAVGYQSEEAFSRAFKREFGQPPSAWRERAGR